MSLETIELLVVAGMIGIWAILYFGLYAITKRFTQKSMFLGNFWNRVITKMVLVIISLMIMKTILYGIVYVAVQYLPEIEPAQTIEVPVERTV